MRRASCATPGSTSLSPVLVQGGSQSPQLEWLFFSIPFAVNTDEGAQQTWPGCSWENFENKTSSFLSSFSKHLDGSKKKENPTRSNELKNEKCQPKLAGIGGSPRSPFLQSSCSWPCFSQNKSPGPYLYSRFFSLRSQELVRPVLESQRAAKLSNLLGD